LKKVFTLIAFALLILSVPEADAAAKKKTPSRADYTKEQQKKFFAEALKICRKEYGDRLHRVVVDYKKLRYGCWHY